MYGDVWVENAIRAHIVITIGYVYTTLRTVHVVRVVIENSGGGGWVYTWWPVVVKLLEPKLFLWSKAVFCTIPKGL